MSTSVTAPEPRAAIGLRPRALSPLLLAISIAFPLALLLSWSEAVTIWQTGNFYDTDDAMRAVEVRDVLAGQGWFDLAAHRLGPPGGLFMHWSRVVDVPLALLERGFGLALPPDMAERATRIVYPLALQLAIVAAMAYAARVLAGVGAMAPAALLIVFGGIGFTQFQPGRIDHHSPQILLLTLMTATLLDSLDPQRARRAALTGLAVALSLAISLENLPFVAVILATLPLAWALDGAPRRAAMLWLAGGLGLAAPILFVATVAPSRYAIASVDAFSAPHLAGALMGCAALALLARATPFLGEGRRGVALRITCLAIVGALIGAVMLHAFPHCLEGPFAGMDPLVKRLWLDHVREVQPIGDALAERPSATLMLIGPLVVSSLGLLAALAIARGLARARWIVLAVLVLVGFGGAAWGMRVAFSLQPLALLGGASAVAGTLAWARDSRRRPIAIVLPVVLFLGCSSLGWAMLPLASSSAKEKADAANDARCNAASALAPLARLPSARTFAPLDAGPFLLAHTGLSVVAGPYHRDNQGNVAVLGGFTAAPEAARDIVKRAGATLVIVCPPDGADRPPRPGDDLAAALATGHPPSWLKPVPLEGTPYRVYSVE